MSTHVVDCTSTLNHDKTPNERLNYTYTHSLTIMLSHYISDRPTFTLSHYISDRPTCRLSHYISDRPTCRLSHYISDRPTCSTLTQLPSTTQTLICSQTHWQMYTATDTIQCSRPDKLELLNCRLTTN